jgi:hypothetical protein
MVGGFREPRLSYLFTLGICVALSARSPAADEKKTDQKGVVVAIDGLQSRAPADWEEQNPTNKMRFKQFKLPSAKKGEEAGDLVIYFFGSGQGGSAEDNVTRWKAQFEPAGGKKIEDVAKTDTFKVSGVDVTYLDLAGTYLSKFPPFDPNAKTVRKPDYRLLGVVFESKDGPYFMKLTGPADTIEHYKKGFDEWLKAFK